MSQFKRLDSMMIEIVEEGEENIYRCIEQIECPIKRFQERNTFFEALKRLKKKFREEL